MCNLIVSIAKVSLLAPEPEPASGPCIYFGNVVVGMLGIYKGDASGLA
jgi:hypothetical protein